MDIKEIARISSKIVEEVEQAVLGKTEVIRESILTLMCNGHLLIEDIPGVGKTTLARSISKTVGGDFRRIQFTPDLLPADITGASIFNQASNEFEYRPGPIFGNVVLVDEINRATPKTQSSLLEAMEERQVSADGITRSLPVPFFVIATQNNVEMTGTYPLPEAQLDRFFSRVAIGYPDRDAEAKILETQQMGKPVDDLKQIIDLDTLIQAQTRVQEVFVHDTIREYIVDIVHATRDSSLLSLGSSPRGSLFLVKAAQAHAAIDGSEFVRPDDVKAVAALTLGHRIMVRGEVRARGTSGGEVIDQIIASVPAPVPVS